MTWSREVFSKNLNYFMSIKGVSQKELAEIVGVSKSTMNEWCTGKKYPRIDKIETLANYFGILKSDLIENKSEEQKEMQKKNNVKSDIALRLFDDDLFLSIVEDLNKLDDTQLLSIKQMLAAFLK